MPTKVNTVKKAPAKATPAKAPGTPNAAREMKVLKAYTVAYNSPTLIADIVKAFDKHGKVAVTAQGNATGLDRKMQQRIQSIGYRRGFNKNLASAIRDDFVTACAKDPTLPKSDVQAAATPRAPKADKVPAAVKAVAKAVVKEAVKDPRVKAQLEKAVAGEKSAPKSVPAGRKRTATKRRTPAQEQYDRSFGAKDAEKAETPAVDEKAARLAAKEAEAAAAATEGAVIVVPVDQADVVADALVDHAEAQQSAHDEAVADGVVKVAEGIAKLEVPLPAVPGALRIGARGTDPVIETNYGAAVGRFRDSAVAASVLAIVDAERLAASDEVA